MEGWGRPEVSNFQPSTFNLFRRQRRASETRFIRSIFIDRRDPGHDLHQIDVRRSLRSNGVGLRGHRRFRRVHPGDPSDRPDTYTLRLLGGTAEGETLIVHGMPRFEIGSEYVVFVRGNNHYVCPVVGGRQGCFRVLQDDGQRRVVTYDERPVVGVEAGDIVVPTNPPPAERRKADRASISLDTFIAEIEAGLRRAADSRSSAETEER